MEFVDPKSERGKEIIEEMAHVTPTTQGDPPPPDLYAQWPYVAGKPEHTLLRLADIGSRQCHYIYAEQFPYRYPGHAGGSFTCPHPDCRAIHDAIVAAVEADEEPSVLGAGGGHTSMPTQGMLPRRIQVQQMTTAEKAIFYAQGAVEELPADVRLTKAGQLLSQARDNVADYVDGILHVPVEAELKWGLYRKIKGRTGVGMLYQLLLFARDHTTGAESVIYIPLRVEPEWAGTMRPCRIDREDFVKKFEFVGERLPLKSQEER